MSPRPTKADEKRTALIVDAITDAFAPLMKADPHAFRVKYRKMAADPFAFYRGTACLFYADVAHEKGHHRAWDAEFALKHLRIDLVWNRLAFTTHNGPNGLQPLRFVVVAPRRHHPCPLVQCKTHCLRCRPQTEWHATTQECQEKSLQSLPVLSLA